MIATIPYTSDADEAIKYLRKYRHDLVLVHKIIYEYNNFPRFSMKFKCNICNILIDLGRYAGLEKEYRICVNGNLNKTAMFYCEKYRALV